MFLNTSCKHPLGSMIILRPVQTSNFQTFKLSHCPLYIFSNPLETYAFEHLLDTPLGTNDNPKAGSNFKLSNCHTVPCIYFQASIFFSNFQTLKGLLSRLSDLIICILNFKVSLWTPFGNIRWKLMFLNTSWKHPLGPMITLRPVQTSNFQTYEL